MADLHWWQWRYIGPNTWSNLAYPIAGWTLAMLLGGPEVLVFAGAMTVLGIGSAAYHWIGKSARRADWLGMYCVFAVTATYAADPVGLNITWWALAIGLILPSLLVWAVRGVGADPVLGIGLVLTMLPPAFGPSPAPAIAAASLGVFAISKLVHSADNARSRWVGYLGHAVWHVGTAVAFALSWYASAVMR